jgi:hypothetical protein
LSEIGCASPTIRYMFGRVAETQKAWALLAVN